MSPENQRKVMDFICTEEWVRNTEYPFMDKYRDEIDTRNLWCPQSCWRHNTMPQSSVARVYANVNAERGPSWYEYGQWTWLDLL